MARRCSRRSPSGSGEPGASLRINGDLYILRVDDLEFALLSPAPPDQDPGSMGIGIDPTREACRAIPGGVLFLRHAKEFKAEDDLFEPTLAVFRRGEGGLCELRIGDELYLFIEDDLWQALTDPANYRLEDAGPFPIDVLRGPLGPAGP